MTSQGKVKDIPLVGPSISFVYSSEVERAMRDIGTSSRLEVEKTADGVTLHSPRVPSCASRIPNSVYIPNLQEIYEESAFLSPKALECLINKKELPKTESTDNFDIYKNRIQSKKSFQIWFIQISR